MGKRGLYILCDRNFSIDNTTSGVNKKIISQTKVFENNNVDMEIVNLKYPSGNKIIRMLKFLFSKDLYKEYFDKKVDVVYIRKFLPITRSFIELLKHLKKNKAQIFCEIPTYPYDLECRTLRQKIFNNIDKYFCRKLKRVIDYIITYSLDSKIWGVNCVNIQNGIECNSIKVKKNETSDDRIVLIAVAQFGYWHGYDRLIKGLNEYYHSKISKDVCLYLVGFGDELSNYKQLVNDYKLEDKVLFFDKASGNELDNLFNESDIAVCSLGCFRKKIYLSSELKSREYLARGIPIIYSTRIDVIPDDFKYGVRFSENEENINIVEIIRFYENLLKKYKKEEIVINIRKFAEENCDINNKMKPIIDLIN